MSTIQKLNVETLRGNRAAGNAISPALMTKLLVPIEFHYEWDWLTAFRFDEREFSVVTISMLSAPQRLTSRERIIGHKISIPDRVGELPSFSEILRVLREEEPDACIVLAEGVLGKLMTLAADLLGIAVFTLLVEPEQLENISRRWKHRSDLFFLANSELFPAALSDDRYGTTLVPAGHPERDLLIRGERFADRSFDDERYGDGHAMERILATIRRWRDDRLGPIQPELSIIVPAYRESQNVAVVCDRLLEMLDAHPLDAEVVLVDDASPDDTYSQAIKQMWRSRRIRAFTKSTPRGMGNAIIHGLRMARAPFVAITMGDGSDEVSRIPEMFTMVRDKGFSLAIGSRYGRPENHRNVPKLYRFWSSCFRFLTGVLIGLKLKDYTNAFRLFNRNIFERYGPEGGGFEISPEITFKAWFATRRVTEVDVCHLKRTSGQSTFSFLRAGPGYGKMLIKAFTNRLTGRWFSLDW